MGGTVVTDVIHIPDAAAQPQEYVQALLATLGERDPLDVLEATPGRVAALVRGIDEPVLRTAPGDSDWSAYHIVGHLLDVEVVYGFRMRLTLTEEAARYPGYDEKGWGMLPRPSFADVLAAFTALRATNAHLLRNVAGEVWSRAGHHGEQGRDPFELQVRKLAGHDLAHIDQMERTLLVVTGRPRRTSSPGLQ
jgi:hypothetical protein